ncbi:hypothetical protein SAMN04487931_107226 [Desulfobacula phenolica]|uniref:Uncharacterized protein n=1 Tax=Desulfobacula phenolica TaxID=90732 RepID=A0A1H2I4K5_9BACT|nr:hypothetical protein SAMN04487931_107226 [Desulfobacula phenolica]
MNLKNKQHSKNKAVISIDNGKRKIVALFSEMLPGNKLVGELHPCLGIDIQASTFTPRREGFRVDVDFVDGDAFFFKRVVGMLSIFEPFTIGIMQKMVVNE